MGEAVMMGGTAALGLFTLGLGVFVLGKPPPLPRGRKVQPSKEFSMEEKEEVMQTTAEQTLSVSAAAGRATVMTSSPQ